MRRTLSVCPSVRLSVCPSVPLLFLFTFFTVESSYERTSKIEKLLFSLMGQRHVPYLLFGTHRGPHISYGHLGRTNLFKFIVYSLLVACRSWRLDVQTNYFADFVSFIFVTNIYVISFTYIQGGPN